MKNISVDLKNHLGEALTTIATCWKVTRRDGTVFGFTDHVRDVDDLGDGITYVASSGYTRSKIETRAELNVDNLELTGALQSTAFTEEDVIAGLWDFADVEIFEFNYADRTQGVMYLRKGNLGEIRIRDGLFVAELRGMMQPLQQNIGRTYNAGCNADLFDARCGLSPAAFTFSAAVTSVTNRRSFAASSLGARATGYFAGGKLTWTSGENDGLSMEVKTFTTGTGAIELFLPMPYNIAVTDTFNIMAGCDKSINTCLSKFNNVVNFRGFPHVPGIDNLSSGKGA